MSHVEENSRGSSLESLFLVYIAEFSQMGDRWGSGFVESGLGESGQLSCELRYILSDISGRAFCILG
jgi:hypothetical protein